MGQVIARKIKKMSLGAKVGLITLSTLLFSVFMYEGWYKPLGVQAATNTYYTIGDTATVLGADGTANLPTAQSTTAVTSATIPTFRGTVTTTAPATGVSWRPATTITAPAAMLNIYGPVYASATNITAITSNFALRSGAPANTWTFHVYDYNPAGTAQNGTLVATSTTVTTTGGTSTTSYTPTYTISGGTYTVPTGHRLVCKVRKVTGSNSTTDRFYYQGATSTTGSWLVVTESAITDTTKPTISTFTVPTASTSLTVSGIAFTAADNVGVTGYLINESATPPAAASITLATAPTTYTAATAGAHTLYAWVKDAAGNVNNVFTGRTVTITLPDTTKPTISTFTVPTTSTSLTVSGIAFTAADNVGVTGYLINESATPPAAASITLATAPTTYTAATAGAHTLYAWVKDAAGNVNNVFTGRTVTITLPDTTKPTISTFTVPTTSTSLTVSGIAFTASDNVGVTGYLINESATPPAAGSITLATAPTTYTAATAGAHTLYAWVKDAAGNVNNVFTGRTVTITLPDTTNPTITTFTIPATSSSLTISGINFVATDNVGVTGYLINESPTTPLASAINLATAPTSYTVASAGNKVLYGWVKDAAGNITGANAGTVVTLPDTTPPSITTFTVPSTSSSLTISGITLAASDAVGVTGYLINESSTPPAASAVNLPSAPTSYTAATTGSHTLYAWARDAAGNVSPLFTSRTCTITLSDTTAPTVTTFTVPATSSSLVVSGISLVATDAVGITGYLITESSTQPAAGSVSIFPAPTTYSAATPGVKTLYAWARDAAGNVSSLYTSRTTTITLAPATSQLMHNATNLLSTYRGGIWGNDKDCSWCHSADTTNVKRISSTITTLEGPKPVIFTRMTSAVHNVPGVFGDDQRTYATQASTNVCEVCHHNTTYHQYSGSKIGRPIQHATHANNNKDCTTCHAHSAGFKADCSSCHGFPPIATTLGGPNGLANPATLALGAAPASAGAHAAHDSLGMICATCHNGYATGVSHPSTSIQIDFAVNGSNWPGKFAGSASFGTFSGNAPTGGSAAVSSIGGTTLVRTTANNTNNSCNVYCHGNWTGSNGSTNPRWAGGASQSNCGTCHGATNAQAPQTGSHTVHANTGTGNYSFNCSKCHATVASGADGHVNGSVQWRLSTSSNLIGATATYKGAATNATGSVALGAAFGDCSNIYCHSNGLDTGATFQTVTWGTPADGNCGTCHGVLSTAPPASAAHLKHVGTAGGYLIACATCHMNVVNTTANSTTAATIKTTSAHVNRVHDAYATANFNTAIATVSAGATSCATTYCHSEGTGGTGQSGDARPVDAPASAPTWNTAASCALCHTGGTTTGPSYVDGTPKANTHSQHVTTSGYTCDVCHYATTQNGTTITTASAVNHINRVYNVSANTSKTAAFTYTYVSTGGTCSTTQCHTNTMTWGANTSNATCTKCHGTATTVANYSSSSNRQAAPGYGTGTVSTDPQIGAHDAHIRSIYNYTGRDVLCSDCHKVPATVAEATHMDGGSVELTWSNLAKNIGTTGKVADRGTLTPAFTSPTCSTNYCHGGVLIGGTTAGRSPNWNDAAYLTAFAKNATNCGKCHSSAPVPTDPTYGFTLAKDHTGIDINVANSCNSCHGHDGSGPNHINGILEASGDCNSCHDYDTRNGGGTWGLGTEYTTGGWGAHAVHINYIKKRLSITSLAPTTDKFGLGNAANVCGVCHSNNEAVDHTTSTPANGRNITLGSTLYPRKFGASNPIFNTVPRTCSNLDCHYLTSPAWQ